MERGSDFRRAAELLAAGNLVVIPTETSYGLAADVLNPNALSKLFSVKQRKPDEPVGIFVRGRESAEGLFVLSPEERALIERYWPGAVNILLRPRQDSPLAGMLPHLASGRTKISVRVSSHPMVQRLGEFYPGPFTSTSANRSGAGDVYAADDIERIFSADDVAYLIDGAHLPHVSPSTVVEWNGTELIVHRQGSVPVHFP